MKKGQREAGILLLVVALLWGYLFFSSQAVLVKSEKPSEHALKCTYFTGTGLISRDHIYTKNGVIGKSACPRMVDL